MSLPQGFAVRLADNVRRGNGGRLLVGGSPLTAMRLSDPAVSMLADDVITVADAASAHLADRLLSTNLGLPDLSAAPGVGAPDITVVIPVRDRPAQLDRTLTALRPLRCVVVDDASHAADQVAAVAHRHGARLVTLATNLGPAGARNAGLRLVATPYVAFVDSDVEITATDLLRLTRHFADPQVTLVGPRVDGIARSPRPRWFERYDAAASSLTLGDQPGVVRPGAAVAWLPSACLVGRTDGLADGFDAELRVGEDVDLVWRLVAAGGRVRYDPSVRAHHDARSTIRSWLGRKAVYGSGGAGLAMRHGDRLAPAVLGPTYAVGAAALLLRRRWSWPVAGAATVRGWWLLRRALPESDATTTVNLASRGLGWAVRQESALLLRHWWPLAAVAATRSSAMRRALLTALAVDTAVALTERRGTADPLGPATQLVGRRLDDLAYGAGLWWGALRARSLRVLLPRRPSPTPTPAPAGSQPS